MEIQEFGNGVVEVSGSRTELAAVMDASSHQYHNASKESEKQLMLLPIETLREIAFLLEDMTEHAVYLSDLDDALNEIMVEAAGAVDTLLDSPVVNDGQFDQFVEFLQKVG